ncbi:hypothetical protein EWM64_g904 [Hericium alpestre]|uniref:BTB domain-containing protein n=1 Tax=Hericium alpestre TaxID=135208 RepID=A0A4Z0A982_9AGAM|nr:hypothetical protein EWM64_g904 [Hericium alpestre]
MPFASSGHWTSLLGRQASHYLSQAPNISHRSIHVSAFTPRASAQTNLSTAQRLLHQTRGLFQAFVGHLTTPGTLRGSGSGHGFHSAVRATRAPTIQQNLSFGTRLALSRPLGAPKLPRPPVVPRSVTQVGLGTARNFSSGRPIFQNLVQNVPIAGRALSEADWDIRKREEQMLQFGKAKKGEKKGKGAAKAEKVHFHDAASSASENVDAEAELDHYFPASPRPQVTTELLIPLAPTPSSRLPLPSNPSSSKHPLLPIPALSELHYDHTNHNLRVSTIFARWMPGSISFENSPSLTTAGSERSSLQDVFNDHRRGVIALSTEEASNPRCIADGDGLSLPSQDPVIERGEVWYEDGSVILQAETTQFCVHKSVLSEHSSVLKAMLSSPEKYDQATMGSCPVVKLDDDAGDMEDMLQTIYRPSYSEIVEDTSDFSMIKAWLQLGRKYEIQYLTRKAHQRIGKKFSLSLDEFEANQDDTIFAESNDDALVDSLVVAHLALSFQMPIIAQIAYYACICTIWTPDHLVPCLELAEEICGDSFHEHGDTILQAIYAGHPRILAGRHTLMFDILCSTPCSACRRKPRCTEGMHALLLQARKNKAFDSFPRIPGSSWLRYMNMADKLCWQCCDALQANLDQKRIALWKEIPKMFNQADYPPL